MKIEKIICVMTLTTAMSLQLAVAQGVDTEVRVTRAYIPTIEDATKLTLIPDTSDDSYIKPDIDYSITPLSIGTTLQTGLYAPTQMSFSEYSSQNRFYLKAGAGYPFNTIFDLYASSVKSSKGYIMGYANQEGRFADIENDYGVKNGSSQNHMRIGAAGGLYVGKQTLEGSLNYNNDRWSRYATTTNYDTYPLYQDIEFNARYGDNFLDMERVNFAIGADAKYFWSREDYNSTTIGVKGDLGYDMLGGNMMFSLGYNSISGSNDYLDNTLKLGVKYSYVNEQLLFGLGLDFYNDNVSFGVYDGYDYDVNLEEEAYSYSGSSDCNYIVPKLNLDYKLSADKAIVYLSVDGELRQNDFGSLSAINPYLMPGTTTLESSVEYDADFGLKGRVANDKFGYNLYVGYTHILNNVYWAYYITGLDDLTTNGFVASYSDQHNINVNLDLEYQPTSNLLFQLGLSQRNFNNDDQQLFADGEANTKIRLDGKYRTGKVQFGVNAEVLSSRECSQILNSTEITNVEIPTTVNMGLSFDYYHNNRFVIFADVDNLLNDDIYNWLHYREYGINFTAGVKIQF